MTYLAPFITVYLIITGVITIISVAAHDIWKINGNPLAYVFWPLIAAMACAVKLRKMWREE